MAAATKARSPGGASVRQHAQQRDEGERVEQPPHGWGRDARRAVGRRVPTGERPPTEGRGLGSGHRGTAGTGVALRQQGPQRRAHERRERRVREEQRARPMGAHERHAGQRRRREGHAEERAPQRHRRPAPGLRRERADQGRRGDHDAQMRQPLGHARGEHDGERRQRGLHERQRSTQRERAQQAAARARARRHQPGHEPQRDAQQADERDQKAQPRVPAGVGRRQVRQDHGHLGELRGRREARRPQRERSRAAGRRGGTPPGRVGTTARPRG